MLVKVNGKVVAQTSTSKLTGITSKQEAVLFVADYKGLGFTDVTMEAEYSGPKPKK